MSATKRKTNRTTEVIRQFTENIDTYIDYRLLACSLEGGGCGIVRFSPPLEPVVRCVSPMNETLLPQREVPDSLMLYGFWYRALPSDQVTSSQLCKAMLLETPLAVGRDRQGRPFALHDTCPHRGMPLSHGRFDGQQVECSYHGWRFDGLTGQCQLIPSLTADQTLKIDRIYARSYACQEHDDFIWVFIPEPPAPGAGFTKAVEPADARPSRSHLQREVQAGLPDR